MFVSEYFFARLFVRGTKYFGLVNLILNKEAVPERWQGDVTPEKIAPLVDRYITDIEYRNKVVAELAQVRSYLGDKGATVRVVKALDEYLTV